MRYTIAFIILFILSAGILITGSLVSYTSTFDTATVGLMSVNIVNGERPLFFYGQPYFGALEAYLAAFYISVFGFSEAAISFSPVSFTLLWIIFTNLLFARIAGRFIGVIAATCVAFSGYYVFWYSIAAYGGYSAIFCLGTAILWLSLRIYQNKSRQVALYVESLLLGIFVALAIWVHALTFPYIAVSAILLGIMLFKEKFRGEICLAYILAATVAMSGFYPFYLETGSFLGGISQTTHITIAGIVDAIKNLFRGNIYELVIWNFHSHYESVFLSWTVIYGSAVCLISALLFSLVSIFGENLNTRRRFYFFIPLLFCCLFLFLYVQHHMAVVKAPRYAIGFWAMVLCIIWSFSFTVKRSKTAQTLLITLFLCWISLQITGTYLFINGNKQAVAIEKATMKEIVKAAERRDLETVITYGDQRLGYKAQKLSMYSKNAIIFANTELERYQKNAQSSELSKNKGYLTNTLHESVFEQLLDDLKITYEKERITASEYILYSNLSWLMPDKAKRSVHYRLHYRLLDGGESDTQNTLLFDFDQDSTIVADNLVNNEIILDMGENKRLREIWFFSRHNPYSIDWIKPPLEQVSLSSDGTVYQKIYVSGKDKISGYFAGDNLYIGGPLGKTVVLTDPNVHTRYIKITLLNTWKSQLSEILVFEDTNQPLQPFSGDIDSIVEFINGNDVQFVYADRWLSAELVHKFDRSSRAAIALPRHSTKFKNRPFLHFIKPQQGNAVVCENSISNICKGNIEMIYGLEAISASQEFKNYTLFKLRDLKVRELSKKRVGLLWNGHLPVIVKDIDYLSPWYFSMGLPYWQRGYVKESGFFHDSWTNGNGKFKDLRYSVQQDDSAIVVYTQGWRPRQNPSSLNLSLRINDDVVLTEYMEHEKNIFTFQLPQSLGKINSVEICSSVFEPPGKDSRKLGVNLKRVEIQ